ncbi:amino acid permease-domain-containing protein [Emericellopsis atlantica]|uniref:Amino acid permease-domain-containing protein n=1 Tax=Emericellopsis atlantica TaxID=2614577 RepID=A0A9P7ZFF3_9HYPO|nr:amino acid permease-domain-containing protein [Emericellopsis atlantica]KAG9250565.1 amino acid permease-domain-containing protein [Emericellopsis atlantica]
MFLAPQDDDNDNDLIRRVTGAPINKNDFVTRAPKEPFRLNFIDALCLVVNRTIGTGIFSGPQEVMKGVKSPGLAMLMWVLGSIYSISGAHVFIEYGLNVPRYVIDGVEQAVPRSGGELHYLSFVFPSPSYGQGTVLLSGVLFGISFICVGNMASNCLDCALRIMQAGNPTKTELELNKGAIYGIAIVIATLTCFIHAFSRRGGILLNNFLAFVKVCFLLAIILSTWIKAGGSAGIWAFRKDFDTYVDVDAQVSTDQSGYTQAFYTVVFAYFGFYQPTYVLGEIKNPRKNLPKSIWWGLGIVSTLYLAVNVCYMIVVPPRAQLNNNVAQAFFARIFDDSVAAKRTISILLAISSFGNIVVWTFTAARMKQEIAKKCFIPFASFFAKNKDLSLGRLLLWLEGSKHDKQRKNRRFGFLEPANHQEKTPVGALCLHLATCVILILTTFGMTPSNAYVLLSRLLCYVLAAFCGVFLALGILILRFRGPPQTNLDSPEGPGQPSATKTWAEMTSDTVNPKLSIVCSFLYLVGNLSLIIMPWIKPRSPAAAAAKPAAWYVVPTISLSIIAFSALWFLGFCAITEYRSYSGRKKFVYAALPVFDWAHRSQPELGRILKHETITRRWEATETHELQAPTTAAEKGPLQAVSGMEMRRGTLHRRTSSEDLQNTDFA